MTSHQDAEFPGSTSYNSLPNSPTSQHRCLLKSADADTLMTIYELDALLTSLNNDLEEVNFTVERKNEADHKSKTLQCVIANVAEGSTSDWNQSKTKQVLEQLGSNFNVKSSIQDGNVPAELNEAINFIQNDLTDEDSDDGWSEMEANGLEPYQCLFCDVNFDSIGDGMQHVLYEHQFDLHELRKKHTMDVYSYLKLINYIRAHKPDVKTIMEANLPLWSDDAYLKPVITDQWLMFDFDDWDDNIKAKLDEIISNELETSTDLKKIKAVLKAYRSELSQQSSMLEKAMDDMNKMREVTKSLVDGNEVVVNDSIKNSDDNGYFESYAHFGIHHEMLNDKVRTESYRDAVLSNWKSFENKLVLDLGCGTGILSMFCAKADAKFVYGVDQSEIVFSAMDIVRENLLVKKIQLIRGRIEDIDLPEPKVDFIISEWMGYFLLFEGMLDSLIYAREKHLAPGGVLLPNQCSISLVGCSDLERHKDVIGFWADVYGFKMSCMVKDVMREASIEVIPTQKILTSAAQILHLDLYKCSTESVNFESTFELMSLRDGTLTAFAGYFDTIFDSLPNHIKFSTGPQSTPTHWKQTVFYLRYPIPLGKDEVLKGHIRCQRSLRDLRSLIVTITINNRKHEYRIE